MTIALTATLLGIAMGAAEPPVSPTTGPASILPQCIDANGSMFVGPSARARECTRQFCKTDPYQKAVADYAMSRPQKEDDKLVALTCITRYERDARGQP